MRSERARPILAAIAALIGSAPAAGAPSRPDLVWIEICDAAHPGRRIPLPLHRDRDIPATGCHAACALMPERRTRR